MVVEETGLALGRSPGLEVHSSPVEGVEDRIPGQAQNRRAVQVDSLVRNDLGVEVDADSSLDIALDA